MDFAEGAGEAEHYQQAQAVCVGAVGEEALKICDFLSFQCPTSSSALTSFFTCREKIKVLSVNVVILLRCWRSVNLTRW